MISEKYIRLINVLSYLSLILSLINNFIKTEHNICLFVFLLTFNKEYLLQRKIVHRMFGVLTVFIITDVIWIVYHSIFYREFQEILFFYYTSTHLLFGVVNTFILIVIKVVIIVWFYRYSRVESKVSYIDL